MHNSPHRRVAEEASYHKIILLFQIQHLVNANLVDEVGDVADQNHVRHSVLNSPMITWVGFLNMLSIVLKS